MKKILVIGEGQLGSMLAQAASRIGMALDRVSLEHAALYRGTSMHAEPLPAGWQAEDYDAVTVEREHLMPCALLDRLQAHPGYPHAHALRVLADRRSQKAMLDQLLIPTATWSLVETAEDIRQLQRMVGGAVIAKRAHGGYDGQGQWRIDTEESPLPPVQQFGELIVERVVPFSREVSLIGARRADGRTCFFPLVENHHVRGVLRCTVAPALATARLQIHAEAMLGRIMTHLDHVGVMALEMFEEDGELLVNEIAPRVHNSGHWSQVGAELDQFELHLRALCAWPLTTPSAAGVTMMLNLIGIDFDPQWLAAVGTRLHWYGKSVRAGRKLGHVNIHGSTPEQVMQRLESLLPLLDSAHAEEVRTGLAILERQQRASALS
jgi:5-(carboxyamino)imidazole ribonucleotide synthase